MTQLETGRIAKTHGISGEVSVEPWCDDPADLLQYKAFYLQDGKKLTVASARIHKSSVLVKFAGWNSIEAAMPFINQTVYIDREQVKLEQGQYLISDLLGVTVSHEETGEIYGKITYVQSTGANDVYHVTRDDNKLFLVPAIGSVIGAVDIESKTMKIVPLEGLFD